MNYAAVAYQRTVNCECVRVEIFFVLREDVKHSTFHLAMNHPHKLFMLISLSLVNKLDEGYD